MIFNPCAGHLLGWTSEIGRNGIYVWLLPFQSQFSPKQPGRFFPSSSQSKKSTGKTLLLFQTFYSNSGNANLRALKGHKNPYKNHFCIVFEFICLQKYNLEFFDQCLHRPFPTSWSLLNVRLFGFVLYKADLIAQICRNLSNVQLFGFTVLSLLKYKPIYFHLDLNWRYSTYRRLLRVFCFLELQGWLAEVIKNPNSFDKSWNSN